MISLRKFNKIILITILVLLLTGCSLIFSLFYKDWRSEIAYRSSSSKKNYYIIEGVTQSHCGCSDIVVKSFKNKKPEFTFYYGGGLFPARKYIYNYDLESKKIDTIIYIPVSTNNFTIPFDSLDNEILQRIDTLIINRPKGSGLSYKVKHYDYKGYIIER